jgi:lauroyl/myristoyl acyltransferase
LGRRLYFTLFKNTIAYSLSMFILRICALVLRPFSLQAKFSFGRLVGYCWYLFDFADRELCRRDLALALGKSHPLQVRRRARRLCMVNMPAYLVEAYFSSRLSRDEFLALVANPSWSKSLQESLAEGKGAIVLTAHFSNEALLCYLISSCGHASCIARYQRVFNSLMVEHRKHMNVDTLNEYETSYDLLLDLLSRNEIILATVDRPLKRVKGVYARFFGHRVIAPYYFVDLARISSSPIFVALLTRENGRYNMHLEGPLYVPGEMNERESREKYCQQVFAILEKYISQYPHEWQWQHKRFAKKHWGILRYAEVDTTGS